MAANILFDHFGHRRKDCVLGKEVIRLPKCRTRGQAPLPVSIRHIIELIRPLIEPSPFRSRAISADLQVKTSKISFFVFLLSDPGKYCIVVNYVVFEAIKIKVKSVPRNPASENVVFLCRLLIFLQTFQTYFCIMANSMDPDQTASYCLQKMTFKITSR